MKHSKTPSVVSSTPKQIIKCKKARHIPHPQKATEAHATRDILKMNTRTPRWGKKTKTEWSKHIIRSSQQIRAEGWRGSVRDDANDRTAADHTTTLALNDLEWESAVEGGGGSGMGDLKSTLKKSANINKKKEARFVFSLCFQTHFSVSLSLKRAPTT